MRVDPNLMYFSLSQTFCRSTLIPHVLEKENARKWSCDPITFTSPLINFHVAKIIVKIVILTLFI